jgi:hypothetical protein
MTDLQLPAVLAKGDNKRVAHTSSDYWSFVYNGFKPTGEAYEGDQGELSPAESDPELPAPVEVVQRPRRERPQREAEKTSTEGLTNTQGTAAGGDDLSSPAAPNA